MRHTLLRVGFGRRRQNQNGGWGESYLACVDKEWTETGVQSLQEPTPGLGDGESGVSCVVGPMHNERVNFWPRLGWGCCARAQELDYLYRLRL